MDCISERELELSTTLNRLIGELNAEASLLPTSRTIEYWTRRDVYDAVVKCKDAMIVAQKCAIQLGLLNNIDRVSASWIEETLEFCDEYQTQLRFVEDELVPLIS
jgi:hypothetical protein